MLRRLGVDDAEHVVRRRGDVLRRRQAAPFLHLQRSPHTKQDELELVVATQTELRNCSQRAAAIRGRIGRAGSATARVHVQIVHHRERESPGQAKEKAL